MNSLKKSITIAFQAYKEWIVDYRQIVSLVILVLLSNLVSVSITNLSIKVNEPLNGLEPFIALLSSMLITLVLMVFLVLVSDFPRMEGNNGYMLIRSSRREWFFGKMIFAVMSIISYVGMLLVITAIPTMGKAFCIDSWSYITRDYVEKYSEIGYKLNVFAVVPEEIYNNYTPFEAVFHICIMISLLLFIFSMIMMIFNLLNKKIVGVFLNVFLCIMGMLLVYSNSIYMFIFPVANAMLLPQNTGTHIVFPIWRAYVYLVIVIVVLLVITSILVKKVTIQKDGER